MTLAYAPGDTSDAALAHRAAMPLRERVEAVRGAVPPVTDHQAHQLAALMQKTRRSTSEGGPTTVTGLEIQ